MRQRCSELAIVLPHRPIDPSGSFARPTPSATSSSSSPPSPPSPPSTRHSSCKVGLLQVSPADASNLRRCIPFRLDTPPHCFQLARPWRHSNVDGDGRCEGCAGSHPAVIHAFRSQRIRFDACNLLGFIVHRYRCEEPHLIEAREANRHHFLPMLRSRLSLVSQTGHARHD
nr:hypothetical protein CFP56_36178 [Quercus suber]